MSNVAFHPLSNSRDVPPELAAFAQLSLQPRVAEAYLNPTINIHPPTPPPDAGFVFTSQPSAEDGMDVDTPGAPVAAASQVTFPAMEDPDATIRPPKPKFRKQCTLTISVPPPESMDVTPYNAEQPDAAPQQHFASPLPVRPALYASAAEQLDHVRAQLQGVRRHLEAAFKRQEEGDAARASAD
ncbi:hypothetical protein PsYK624_150690 [Phanerochaete sordida]|uniref:Uncharacterized protein n=1 Tax=Phanerochaete sordida TaxID=48140 RepID=A0A9P3LLZ7_9APHY|nr:hypothetical protein PsYK624_150690 [Phanerochaete sordida]